MKPDQEKLTPADRHNLARSFRSICKKARIHTRGMIDARKESGLTQKKLSEITGINQADICRLEKGNGNPSLRILQRLAAGMNMRLKLEFVKAAE